MSFGIRQTGVCIGALLLTPWETFGKLLNPLSLEILTYSAGSCLARLWLRCHKITYGEPLARLDLGELLSPRGVGGR